MNKKILIASAVTIASLGFSSIAIAQPEAVQRVNGIVEYEPDINYNPTNYVYPDNSDKKPSDFQATRKKLQKLRLLQRSAKIRQIKLVSYEEYLKKTGSEGGSIIQNMEVHPKRQFFMVDIEVPELEIANRRVNNKEPQNIKLKNARVKQLYDAETGMIFGNEITGNRK